MARIELKNVSKSFPDRHRPGSILPAVLDLHLTIEAGEFMVLVGPSGSGKTTTLRMVAGLEDPSSGSILFDGERINHCPPHERDVAMVFQRDALYPHMTVSENLSFGLRLRNEKHIDQRVQETAALLGITPFLNRMPRELSGGQRQRVAVGRVIVRRPAVFLFDEPFTNLDGPLRYQLRREIALLQRQLKVTTLYVTHDQAEAMVLGDRIAVLHQGRLQQVSTPLKLYAQPANAFVAGMFGAPPMNLLRAVVLPGAVALALHPAEHGAPENPVRLELSDKQRNAMSGMAGCQVLLGVRPEQVTLQPASPKNSAAWPGIVNWVEWLGAEMIVRLIVHEQPILARLRAAMPYPIGTPMDVHIDPADLRIFDATSGQAIV